MSAIIQRQQDGLILPRLARRGLALLGGVLIICATGTHPVNAQSSKLHAAFEDSDSSTINRTVADPTPGTIRLVSGQQKPVTKSLKPATPPQARKSTPVKKATPAAESQSAAVEELPPGPLKAVL